MAFTLAVADRIEGRGAENLRKTAAAVRKNPRGFGTGNDRKHLANWAKYPHNSYGEPTRLAEHAVAEWAALETAQAAYNGVRDFEKALHWDAHYAGERAEARAEADRAGLAGRDQARAERAASGRTAAAWEAAVERLTEARMRVHAAGCLPPVTWSGRGRAETGSRKAMRSLKACGWPSGPVKRRTTT
ncbi:hypothetical protein O1L60_46310 [Streptomyces diastatochromogenes]|nr:hypothetical protein [Streptomyces diastatochromogenes]